MSPTAKQSIINHALSAFLSGPYSRVSLREIAARSGYSHTYVHQLFGSKQNIFAEALHEAQRQMEDQAAILPNDPPQVVMLKIIGTNPLNQPILTLMRKAAGDPEMLDAFRVLWVENKHPLISALVKNLDPSKRYRIEGSPLDMSAISFFVWGFAAIFSPFIVEMLGSTSFFGENGTDNPELKAQLHAAPQELLLNFFQTLASSKVTSHGGEP